MTAPRLRDAPDDALDACKRQARRLPSVILPPEILSKTTSAQRRAKRTVDSRQDMRGRGCPTRPSSSSGRSPACVGRSSPPHKKPRSKERSENTLFQATHRCRRSCRDRSGLLCTDGIDLQDESAQGLLVNERCGPAADNVLRRRLLRKTETRNLERHAACSEQWNAAADFNTQEIP